MAYAKVVRSCGNEVLELKKETLRYFGMLRRYGLVTTLPEFDFRLSIDEAVENAFRHGNNGDPDKIIDVMIECRNRILVITVTDEGPGFSPESIAIRGYDHTVRKPCGLGILLLKSMGSVSWNEQGNSVRIELLL